MDGGSTGEGVSRGSGRGSRLNDRKGGLVRGPVSPLYSAPVVANTASKGRGPVKGCYTCGGPHYAKQCGVKRGGEEKKRKAN